MTTTKGVQSSHEIFAMYRVLLIVFGAVLVGTAFSYFNDFGKYDFVFFLYVFLSFLILLGGLSMTYNWLSKFGKFQTTDEEFIEARKKVRRSQIIWVWANLANLIWWIVYIKFL